MSFLLQVKDELDEAGMLVPLQGAAPRVRVHGSVKRLFML